MKSLVLVVFVAFLGTVSCRSSLREIPEFFRTPESSVKSWAVLVAGLQGWENYRHQADVCHAYQLLKDHGIPEERIIVMMMDDIAFHKNNPTQGVIINHPNGSNVYQGVPKDYTDEAVTPENFLAIMRGDKKSLKGKGSGKVLESGPNDNVFVYFSDHGAPGVICFPHSVLTAKDLNNTINYMYKNKTYGKMLIYVEACESGSMFKNILPENVNVFATTAADSSQPSMACYYDEVRRVYLGDCYSVNWMEDSEAKMGKLPLSEFQGEKEVYPRILPKINRDQVQNRNVHIETLKRTLMRTNSAEQHAELLRKLSKMVRNRMFLTRKVKDIVTVVVRSESATGAILKNHSDLTDWECYDDVREYFNGECFNLSKNPYSLGSLYVLVNLCEKKIPSEILKKAMDKVCVHPPVYDIV